MNNNVNYNLNNIRIIIFLLSVSLVIWLSVKEFKKINPGLFLMGGVIFIAFGSYFTNGFDYYNQQFNIVLNEHPFNNEDTVTNGIKITKIKDKQEINPNFLKAEKINNNYKFSRLNDYPMLDIEHRNINDCTIDGSCIIKPSRNQNIINENQEIKVNVYEDQLCHHGKAYNPYLTRADIIGEKKAMLEGFELTGTDIHNKNDDLYNYNMKTVNMILPINAPYEQEYNKRIDRSKDLCHNCKIGICHHGICHSI